MVEASTALFDWLIISEVNLIGEIHIYNYSLSIHPRLLVLFGVSRESFFFVPVWLSTDEDIKRAIRTYSFSPSNTFIDSSSHSLLEIILFLFEVDPQLLSL